MPTPLHGKLSIILNAIKQDRISVITKPMGQSYEIFSSCLCTKQCKHITIFYCSQRYYNWKSSLRHICLPHWGLEKINFSSWNKLYWVTLFPLYCGFYGNGKAHLNKRRKKSENDSPVLETTDRFTPWCSGIQDKWPTNDSLVLAVLGSQFWIRISLPKLAYHLEGD